jgi:hypothetical protein
MAEEARRAVGTHDFAAFAASGSVVRDTVRTVRDVEVLRRGDEVQILVRGDGFLYNMVRILAGTLIGVGSGKIARRRGIPGDRGQKPPGPGAYRARLRPDADARLLRGRSALIAAVLALSLVKDR